MYFYQKKRPIRVNRDCKVAHQVETNPEPHILDVNRLALGYEIQAQRKRVAIQFKQSEGGLAYVNKGC